MHGDGLGMSVGEAVEEHYFSPTNNSPAAGSGANGSPAAGGTLQVVYVQGPAGRYKGLRRPPGREQPPSSRMMSERSVSRRLGLYLDTNSE